MTKNILFYAQGGGLGHLQRSMNMINVLQLFSNDDAIYQVFVASSSIYLTDYLKEIAISNPKLQNKLQHIKPLLIPQNFENDSENNFINYQKWLVKQINDLNIGEIYLDVFPCGLVGEWNNITELLVNFSEIKFYSISRHLKWQNYKQLITKPLFFEASFVVEALESEHLAFITQHSKSVKTIKLIPFQYNLQQNSSQNNLKTNLKSNLETPFWLIIHSEPLEELLILLEYTLEKQLIQKSNSQIIIISQISKDKFIEFLQKNSNIIQIDLNCIEIINTFDTQNLIIDAEKIISACGFNVMQECENFSNKHEYIPFERRYDDQFWRASQRKKATV
jgi:predicted glycosyltransferase